MKKQTIYHLFVLILGLIAQNVIAQTDDRFWFVAPDITSGHGTGGEPIFLRLSSVSNPVDVTISKPADTSFTPIDVHLDAKQTDSVELDIKDLENRPAAQVNNNGLLIESEGGDITTYYEVNTYYNPDLFALKGDNALGKNFVVPTQTEWDNGAANYDPDPYNEVHIVATEDDTEIEITPSSDSKGGHPAGVPFTIVLDKGETYNLRAENFSGSEHLAGTEIEVKSGGDIAVTIGDDSVHKNTCYDLNGDQLIPERMIGQEYLVMKGEVYSGERTFITAVEDGTEIYIDGSLETTLNANETYDYELPKNITHIKGSKPIYVYHLAGFSCEMGGAVLPTIENCTGSHRVSFNRSTSRPFYLNLMVRDGGRHGFTIHYKDGSTFDIPPHWFTQEPNSEWWTLKDSHEQFGDSTNGGIPVSQSVTITNDTRFHLGIINGSHNTGCFYGYFSDFSQNRGSAEAIATNSQIIARCFGDSIRLKASGGYDYEWTPHDYLSDPYSPNPIATPPPGIHNYSAEIKRNCWPDTNIKITIQVFPKVEADFTVDKFKGCSPLAVDFENQSVGATNFKWDIEGDGTFDHTDTTGTPPPTSMTTYTNTTKQDTTFHPRLVVDYKGECPDEMVHNITVYPEIDADFKASDTIGCQPLAVNFANFSSGDTNTFYWNFGDGATSKKTNPQHTFTNLGKSDSIYQSRLIAESPYYCRDTAFQNIVTHPYVDIHFAMDTVKACSPFKAKIYNQSTGVDTFYLDYGDGTDTTFNSFNHLQHTYRNTDTITKKYTLTLIGFSGKDCRDTLQRTITVYPSVKAKFGYNPQEGCDSVLIQFSDSSSGHNINRSWSFGDGASSIKKHPAHQYLNKTAHTQNRNVSLVVESDHYCRDTFSANIPIYPYVNAKFAVDTAYGCPPFKAQIHNKSQGIDYYTWKFGDGSPESHNSNANFFHLYDNNSFNHDTTYQLQLIGENTQGCTDTMTQEITVYQNIQADFTVDRDEACHPAEFNFSNQSKGNTTDFWYFGDNTTSETTSPHYTYKKNNTDTAKTFKVSLLVTGPNNTCTDVKDTVVTVNPYIQAEFTVEDYIGCHPFSNTLENSSIGDSNSYKWYINGTKIDTAPDNQAPFQHTFTNDSSTTNKQYAIRLEAKNKQQCTDVFRDTVAVYPNVIARYKRTPDSAGCHPFQMQFSNNSQNANKFYWNFDDNSSSSLTHPTHTFYNYDTTDNQFSVKLIAQSHHCSDSITKPVTVYSVPRASFEIDSQQGCSPLDVTFNNTSLAGTDYTYFFDDGTDSTMTNPKTITHAYTNTGTANTFFHPSLVVNNDHCSDTIDRTIKVFPEVRAKFQPDTAGCSPLRVNFRNHTINAEEYRWDFGDGMTASFPQPQHDFFNSSVHDSVFTVTLQGTSHYGCTDTTKRDIRVHPSPKVSFSATPKHQYFPDTTIQLINETNPGPWNFKWDFDDGDTTSAKNPQKHLYTDWGIYNISLEAYSNHCEDVDTVTIQIYPPQPIAEFEHSGSGCVPLTVEFTNYSKYAHTYQWDFDDGDTSSQKNPTHTYQEPGIYDIILTITGDGGSRETDTIVQVHPKPIVDFSIHPDTVALPEARINTHNFTRRGVRYLWEWGDGTTSTEETSEHVYGPPPDTAYTIKLTAWTKHQCKASDSLYKGVRVIGQGVLEYPNVFIPSKSGPTQGSHEHLDVKDNSVFRPASKGVIEYHLQIFNRWGERIFESHDINKGWDGYYQGKLCEQGVYVWKVEGKYSNGEHFKKMGDVTLLIR